MLLDPKVAAAGVRLIACDTINSTNTEACALGRAGEHSPLWITAKRQTAGRGRRGNVWISEPGNLYASLLLPSVPVGRAGELAFVAGLGVYDAVAELAPPIASRLALKWPNDVLLGGAKLAGVLIEAEKGWAVIGIGINCAHHPKETTQPATDLTTAGAPLPAEKVFAQLSKTMHVRLRQWANGAGFSVVRSDWIIRAAGIGKDIRVRLPAKELAGSFQGLDEAGHLLLRLADGRVEAVSSGEVFALSAAAG
jgi:BirA family transcriptional regulator, biotin operon repressor / biotin---[acetyl-CoA-carboxylase] ligase